LKDQVENLQSWAATKLEGRNLHIQMKFKDPFKVSRPVSLKRVHAILIGPNESSHSSDR